MEIVIIAAVVVAVAGAVAWGRRNFRREIDRAKRIRRANRDDRP